MTHLFGTIVFSFIALGYMVFDGRGGAQSLGFWGPMIIASIYAATV